MSNPDAKTQRPVVSVIVPARNEEACLGACLESLTSQTGIPYEIIVVDDGSTDRTREIAASFATVRVIEAGPLPEGWIGKNHAVSVGASQARGKWLLFTDADTVHLAGSLKRAVLEAQKEKVSLLSYSPEQEIHDLWEKAVMPVIFAELAKAFKPSDVSDPASTAAAANGQYLLITREAYDAVGGHAAVASSLLEDVALARAVKTSGRKIFFRYGGDAVRTRMYRSFAQLREGWTKNLALLFPSPVWLAVVRLMEFLLILMCVEVTVLSALIGRYRFATLAIIAFCAMCGRFVVRIRKAHFPSGATSLTLLGLPLFSYLLLRSKLYSSRGSVSWKGRTYNPHGNKPARPMNPKAVEGDQTGVNILRSNQNQI